MDVSLALVEGMQQPPRSMRAQHSASPRAPLYWVQYSTWPEESALQHPHMLVLLQVLWVASERPHAAASLGRLAWALGKGVGEYLLQQVGWALQDTATLTASTPLPQVLQRRCGIQCVPHSIHSGPLSSRMAVCASLHFSVLGL